MFARILPVAVLALAGGVLAGGVTAPSAPTYDPRPLPSFSSSLPTTPSLSPTNRATVTVKRTVTATERQGKAKGKKNPRGKSADSQESDPAVTPTPSASESLPTQSVTGSETLPTESSSRQE
jgi:hypothetical protein